VIADVGDRGAAGQVFDFANKVDQGVLGPSAFGQGQLSAGDLNNDGDEVFRPVKLEVINLHGN
jgi:hypothetical protein